VARSTFYTYFSSKRDLFMTVASAIMSAILTNINTSVDAIIERFGPGSPHGRDDEAIEQSLVDLMSEVFGLIRENHGMTRIFLNELVGIDREMTELFDEFEERLTDGFERLVRFGREIGFVSEVDTRRTADFIVGGLIHIGRKVSMGSWWSEIEDVSREFIHMHVFGLRQPDPAR